MGKSKDDLKKQLDELKTELVGLRTQKIAGGSASKLSKMYDQPSTSALSHEHRFRPTDSENSTNVP